jgi:DNA-directed RNA polymerase subunit E'/Rpb7
MSQVNLYYRTQLENKVSLLPEQIDGEIDNHILENLRVKVEKKITDIGYVVRITRLISYKHGMIDKTNFMGTTVFPVEYECFICSPVKDLEIICHVENIVDGYIVSRNGPITVVVDINNIDTQRFDVVEKKIVLLKTKKPIEKGNFIKVSIININSDVGENTMVSMAKLLNIATADEIKLYEKDQNLYRTGYDNEDSSVEFI